MVPDRKILALGNVIKEGGGLDVVIRRRGFVVQDDDDGEAPFSKADGVPWPHRARHRTAAQTYLTARTIIRFKPDTHSHQHHIVVGQSHYKFTFTWKIAILLFRDHSYTMYVSTYIKSLTNMTDV